MRNDNDSVHRTNWRKYALTPLRKEVKGVDFVEAGERLEMFNFVFVFL